MDYDTWDKKLSKLLKKEISDYKTLVGKLPEDERIISYYPTLVQYENNIQNLVDVYASSKALTMVGKPIVCSEKDGTLHYHSKETKVKLKKNGGMYG